MKSNIDSAFLRRFQSVVHFPMPTSMQRREIWRKSFPENVKLDDAVSLDDLADQYEFTGASIMNVVRDRCLFALGDDENDVHQKTVFSRHIKQAIRKEIRKST